MAGFELIVRPVVFPNIRPSPARMLPPEGDPEKGKFTINGSGGGIISLSYNFSASAQFNNMNEKERVVDVARVYQVEDLPPGGPGDATPALRATTLAADDGVNRDNYVDIEVANTITMRDGRVMTLKRIEEASNISILERDKRIVR